MQLSNGPYSYNRFDLYEKKAEKDYDGDGTVESSKEEYFGSKDKAIKKAMKKESYLEPDMKKRGENNEKARKSMAKVKGQSNPHFGSGPAGSMTSEHVTLNKGVNNSKLPVMENNTRMSMYSRTLGVMGAQYSGRAPESETISEDSLKERMDYAYYSGYQAALDEMKAADVRNTKKSPAQTTGAPAKIKVKPVIEDYVSEGMMKGQVADGGSAPQQIKAKLAKGLIKKKKMSEGMLPGGADGQAEGGNAPKQIKAKLAKGLIKKKMAQKSAASGSPMEECIDASDVCNYLVAEGFADNIVSAEVMFDHMSDEMLCDIESSLLEEVLS